jgi:predicted 2-oxoglutarate/Fe(II)-dependent dioxygenase YbiX
MNIIRHSSDIWTIPNFISERACEELIFYSEMKGYQPAEVSLSTGAKMMKNIRNNQRLLYEDFALAAEYWARLSPFCPALIADWQAVGLNEQFRFYKYESSERFKRHIDGRFRRNEQEESRITFMIYLNDDFEGGHTDFDHHSIKPSTGDALCFIHEQKHEGCPVLSGTKYVLRSDVMYRKIII